MAESEPADGDEPKGSESRQMWARAGIAGALGFELVGLVLAGAFLGVQFDARFDTSPVGLLVGVALAMVTAGWHVYLVTRRFLLDGEE